MTITLATDAAHIDKTPAAYTVVVNWCSGNYRPFRADVYVGDPTKESGAAWVGRSGYAASKEAAARLGRAVATKHSARESS